MDLTKIEKPFGLLDKETQRALITHGGPIEAFNGDRWVPKDYLRWEWQVTYRVKPEPPKPREWWAAFVDKMHIGMWSTEAMAHDALRDCASAYKLIHVREVLE